MAHRAFRFLHAGDFRLHEVIAASGYEADGLRDVLAHAPYQAVARVFDVAIAEQVAFVVLSGELLHPFETTPRGILLLLEQFERLASHHIAVYWAGGNCDGPEAWPDALTLPENVTYFPRRNWLAVTHYVDEQPVASVIGRSSGNRPRIPLGEFPNKALHDFTIGVYCGEAEAEALASTPVHYWALGGRATRRTLIEQPQQVAHYCGAPQARVPHDIQPHGCTLVDVDGDGNIRATHVPTDYVRFRIERIFIHDKASAEDVLRVLAERTRQLAKLSAEPTTLVTWEVESGPATAASLLLGETLPDLLRDLSQKYSQGKVWPIAIVPLVDGEWPESWYQEDSLLGDFLRMARLVESQQEPLVMGAQATDGDLAELFPWKQLTADDRNRLLREAALVGAAALRGETSAGRSPS